MKPVKDPELRGSTLTIRGLTKRQVIRLRILAACHGRSMEAEVRSIIAKAIEADQPVVDEQPR